MPGLRLFVFAALLSTAASTGAHAQWLNFATPGTPRTPDGKPNLTAPAPRAADGKPDLSGVWHPQPTSLAEWKRILGGDRVDAINQVNVPGQGLDNVSKYLFNILLDFKPDETPMRAETADILRRWHSNLTNPATACPLAFPGMFSFPSHIKSFSHPG